MMKLQDLLKDIELGKVYTDKDKPPFKVEEEKLAEGKNAKLISNLKSDLSKLDKLVKSKKPTDSFLKKDMIVLTKAANKIFDRIETFKYFTEGKTLWELTEEYVNEGKWKMKGKYLNMPDGEESSIPGNYGRDAIAVGIKNDTFKIYMQNGKLYTAGDRYDKSFKNLNDLANWLNKEKAKYYGIDNR